MQAIHAENVTWKAQARGVREAKIYSATHGSDETRIDMVEVPAGSYIPPHRHSSRTEFITILSSAGAQLQIGDRIFRPIAGQVFHREPGDILALTNDSQHPFCYSVVRFRYEASDIEHLGKIDDEPAVSQSEFGERQTSEENAGEAEVEVDSNEVEVESEPESDDSESDDGSEEEKAQEAIDSESEEAEEDGKSKKKSKKSKSKENKKKK